MHNVGNSWWGTGLDGTGLNTQGVLLMQLRDSHLRSVSGPDSPPVTVAVPDSLPVTVSVPDSPPVTVSVPDSPPVTVSVPDSPPVTVSVPDSPQVTALVPDSPPVTVSVPDSPPVTVSVPDSPPVSYSVNDVVSIFHVGGGPEEISAIVYTESNNQLPIADVISILKQPDMDKVSNIPPQHPKGGQVFLISDGNNKARQNNWTCDGYPWVNKGKRPNKKAGKKQPRPCDEDQPSVINPAPDSAKKQSFFSSTPISTPQSILKKCKASPSIKPSAAKKIRFEHLPSLGDSEQHSVQTENFTTVNDFNFTALPSSPTPVTSSATPSRPTPPQSVPVSIPSVPSPSLPSSSSPVRQSPIHRGRLWQEFNGHELTFKEKTDIKFDKKLCCQTMNFCQSVTKSQFPCITGFQNTWRVPVLENKKWIYQHKMRSQPSPSVQIHHTGCDHWITSCQDPNGTIYVLDSMNGKTLTTSVQIQMSMIYGKGKTVVPVKIPNVQQQKNSIDCGVFAIVFMVEFCFNNFIGRDNVNFDTYTMRDHLIKCIESQQFSPFPKTKPTRTKVLSLKNTSVNFSIEKECTARCNLPNLFEDMVCCDRCSAWYHYGCVLSNNSNTFSGSLSFTCSNCSSTP